nr:alkylated DNA repair protein ALKBH8 homolog isoform X1 [Ziziphus jujuba var. spinosa]
MGLPRFGRPKGVGGSQLSPNLYVANCGPAVGISYETIALVFGAFGEVSGVHAADESGARVVVSFAEEGSARAAMEALDGRPCQDLGGRSLHIRYSVLRPPTSLGPVNDSVSVSLMASELNIPGLYLLHDFVSCKEEKDLLAAVDERPWKNLSKRRVQHYGYEFCYETRNVDSKQHLGELPSFVSPVLEKISMFPSLGDAANKVLNQLTVNEYPPGVGLSPHIDTHSAFEGLIFSLSLAGPCIMEFRRYVERGWLPKASSSTDMNIENPERNSNFLRRAVYLPPRSMLLLSGEARYAWHHYIPHHKIDMVKDRMIRRGSRRVSFTFREFVVFLHSCAYNCKSSPHKGLRSCKSSLPILEPAC